MADDDHLAEDFTSKVNIDERGKKDEATPSKQKGTPKNIGKKTRTNNEEPELPDNDNGELQEVDYFVLFRRENDEGVLSSYSKKAARVINSHMLGEDAFDPRCWTTRPSESLDARTLEEERRTGVKNIAQRRQYSGHPNSTDYCTFWKVPADFSVAEIGEKIENETYIGVKVYMTRIVNNEIMRSTHQGKKNIPVLPVATPPEENIDPPTGQN
ncbi:uncharacterized protein LOC131944401 [Physella acuta]|uniref:uncharacterized protein LOC131944401 n=1 Tax=Physella acuta TaxID=109671 RepID=UPI0027DCFA1F|nr:uncharacterized protein LOC131944401 [Physella acuta]XP_059160965.1 uncharacterized protein LOC131944401 [Physella acuta]